MDFKYDEDLEQIDKLRQEEIRNRKNKYIERSQLPQRFRNKDIVLIPAKADLEAFRKLDEIRNNIKDFILKGQNLYICSNKVGNGKTTCATKLLIAYIDTFNESTFYEEKCPALFINVSRFLQERKMAIDNRDPALIEKVQFIDSNILTANLVIFDDIADKKISDYDADLLYYWIDGRTANMKSCIYTSNLLPEELKNNITEKLWSRIIGYSTIIKFIDGDHRFEVKK